MCFKNVTINKSLAKNVQLKLLFHRSNLIFASLKFFKYVLKPPETGFKEAYCLASMLYNSETKAFITQTLGQAARIYSRKFGA